MKKILLLTTSFILINLNISLSCTGICTTDNKKVFYAMNEDWNRYDDTFELTIFPGNTSKYGVICVINPKDGDWRVAINEKGLCYDSFAARDIEVTLNSDKPRLDYVSFCNKALYTCETVDEVIDFYNQHYCPWMSFGQIMFTDRFGNSAIFEGNKIIKKEKGYQVCTNFYQSMENPDDRFNKATYHLEKNKNYSQELVKDILKTCSQNSSQILTQFSLIYDANEQDIYIYHQINYNKFAKINFNEAISSVSGTSKRISLFHLDYNQATDIYNPIDEQILSFKAYPNPFQEKAIITFKLKKSSYVNLKIYNCIGQEIECITDNFLSKGEYQFELYSDKIKPGLYICSMDVNGKSYSKKLIAK